MGTVCVQIAPFAHTVYCYTRCVVYTVCLYICFKLYSCVGINRKDVYRQGKEAQSFGVYASEVFLNQEVNKRLAFLILVRISRNSPPAADTTKQHRIKQR